jgi:AraC-like DNA-binding protein
MHLDPCLFLRTLLPHRQRPAAQDYDLSVEIADVTTAKCLDQIVGLMTRYTDRDGVHPTQLKRVTLLRAGQRNELMPTVYEPSLCLIAQGSKRVMLGDDVFVYDRARYLVASVDLPVVGEVLEATPERPYLCIALRLEAKEIAAMVLEADLPPPAAAPARALYLSQTTSALAEAMLRLLRLLDTPEDAATLAPLAEREILYWLLKSEEGWRLRQMASAHTHSRRIARAIEWIRSRYAEPLRVEKLASDVSMSSSSFHEHFRAVTAMSPLQYQKQVRLQEARRLLLSEAVDAATAGHRVGYESPSQFSREYSRLFGAPPAQDIARLRRATA